MLKNSKGFTFTEALVAFSITLVICITVAPIINIVHYERKSLHDKRIISSFLHDELQNFIYDSDRLPHNRKTKVNNRSVQINIILDDKFIEACADWDNRHSREEEVCLYGIPISIQK